jgi:23S rRNA (cytosine1962-C5)-methyltransferase
MSSSEPTFQLRKPLDRVIRDGHPWVYRDAVTGSAAPGAVVRLVDARGAFVARGIADAGPIAMRVFTTRDEALSPSLLAARVARAAELRVRLVPPDTTAYRLLHGEGDRLPGLVCDVYGSFATLKTDGAGAAAWRDAAADALRPVLDARGVHTLLARAGGRAGPEPVLREGSAKATVLYGPPPPARLEVREHGTTLLVDLLHGQKTGLFLDQRESRAYVRRIARGQRVLNLYAYTGGFSVAAGLGGAASVETVDVAPGAIALAEATWAANGLDATRHRTRAADVPAHLAELARARARFDLVIADPPSFAPSEESLQGALRSYRALHAASLALLAPGGYYLAGSCSSHVDRSAFAATVLEAARRAKRSLQLLDAWGAPPDHPRLAAFPEGDYLKNLLFRVE